MSDALLDIVRRLNAIERRLGQTEVKEVLTFVPITAYTPTYVGETTAGTTTYTTQYGVYTRIGSLVIAIGYVVWTNATGTGNANISLPLTAASAANQITPVALYTDGVTFGAGAPQAVIIPNTTHFRLYYPTSNAATTIIQVEAAGQVAFTATYFV